MTKRLATQMAEALEEAEGWPDGATWVSSVTDESLARMDWAAGRGGDDLDRIKTALRKYAEEARRLAELAPVGDAEMMREDAEACEWLAGRLEALP